jgi:hypothetical protein
MAALQAFADSITVSVTDPFSEPLHELPGVETYRYWIPFRCSRGCGASIRMGELYAQTSPDLRPLERAHAACIAGRKGTDTDRTEVAA